MKPPKILLLGKDGQVGRELQRTLGVVGHVAALGKTEANFQKPDELKTIIERIAPEVIVNAAAYTAVDQAEGEAALANRINGEAVGILASTAAKLGAWLVHYSTDYVFDGKKSEPYIESDTPAPLSIYGHSKLAGDQAIQSLNPAKHIILRTSWIYAPHGKNFLKTILRLARERDNLNIVADQFGAPTSAALIADATAQILHQILYNETGKKYTGLYNLAASGQTTWYDFACCIIEWARATGLPLKVTNIGPIATSAYPTPAQRPANSRLDTQKIRDTFSLCLPAWQEQARQTVETLSQPYS